MPANQNNFALTLARPVVTPSGDHPHLVHLAWRTHAPETSRLVQVYLNGRLAAVTNEPPRRELWLTCDRTRAQRIELLHVDAEDARREQPERLAGWSPAFRGEFNVAIVRDPSLPIDTRVTLEVDGEPREAAELFPPSEPRPGFGGLFGVGAFGEDDAAGPGLGAPGSELGLGPLGADGSALRFHLADLAPGEHTAQLLSTDGSGLDASDPLPLDSFTINAMPRSASSFEIAPDFTLSWR